MVLVRTLLLSCIRAHIILVVPTTSKAFMLLVIQACLQRKEQSPPDWHPNKNNLTFAEVLKATNENHTWLARIEDFKPTMFSDDIPMLGKVKKEWLEDPQQYRK